MAMTPEQERAFVAKRTKRNLVIGLALAALVLLFYAITVVRV